MDTNTLVVMIATGVFGLLIVGASALLVWVKRNGKDQLIKLMPALQPVLEQAAKSAALLIEWLDKQGLLDDLKAQGKDKLDLAVDQAVIKAETMITELLNNLGLENVTIDIPEATLKDMIQKYVFENPNLFPSSKTETKS